MNIKRTFLLALSLSVFPIVQAGEPLPSACPRPLVAHTTHGEPRAEGPVFWDSKKRPPIQSLSDRAQIRRLWLDLTGRVPIPEVAEAYVASEAPDKWEVMVEDILATDAFVERWTTFFDDLFLNYNTVGLGILRNNFHDNIRKSIAENQPIDQLCTEILLARGTNITQNSTNFLYFRDTLDGPFRLDYLDDLTGFITETMLGVQTTCISCHDGAYHLEQVNKGLSTMTRSQFWGMAAFLSKSYFLIDTANGGSLELFIGQMKLIDLEVDNYNRRDGFLFNSNPGHRDGEYRANSEAGEGMRPPRNGGLVEPAYLTTGEGPREGETRREALARLITSDRQFARNFVNRVWAHFMGKGFVEPVASWDLGRLDAQTAAANNTTIQAQTPKLMEWLTDRFIADQFDLKKLVRTIVTGPAYRLDSKPGGDDWPNVDVWRLEREPRRLEAEAVVDAYFDIHGMRPKYLAVGYFERVFTSTWALPGPTEPSLVALSVNSGNRNETQYVRDLGFRSYQEYRFFVQVAGDVMARFGRGDYAMEVPRTNQPSVQNALVLFNHEDLNYWIEDPLTTPFIRTMLRAMETNSREAVYTEIFRRILFRDPTPEELALVVEFGRDLTENQAVLDLVWSLFNHPDFLYR